MDPYKVLNVSTSATLDDIKKAYRKLSIKHHPDNTGGNAELFNKLTHAYKLLCEDAERGNSIVECEYDMLPRVFSNQESVSSPHQPTLFDMLGLSNTRVQPSPISSPLSIGNLFKFITEATSKRNMECGVGMGSMEEVFEMGGLGGINMFKSMGLSKPPTLVKVVEITLDEAYKGVIKPINIERNILEGTLKRNERETIYVSVERGVDDGEIIRLKERGHRRQHNSGDLEIHVKIVQHGRFIRRGLELVYKHEITFRESLLGFEFKIKHLNGKEFKLEHSGSIVLNHDETELVDMGMVRGEDIGKLIVRFEVTGSKKISEEQAMQIGEILNDNE